MSSEILINVRPVETRVAYLENGVLTDLTIDRKTSPTLVGSIHRGKVIRVLPGMQAAFVDIGLDRAAFLYVGDVRGDIDTESGEIFAEDTAEASGFDEPEESAPAASSSTEVKSLDRPRIQELLSEGQTILVQVAKDPLGSKGARITTHISLPGRHVVFMPTLNHQGVSRRIEDPNERERLRQLVQKLSPKGGVIVRTAGEGATDASIKADLDYLHRLWEEVHRNYEKKKTPGLVHAELDVELRALRDMLSEEISRVLIDDPESHRKVVAFLGQFMPKYKNKVKLYTGTRPLFDQYEIDLEISRSMERKVWLKSGGYIVIDEAEALVVIDVNTGRYVGKKDLEDTIVKTNLEAVREIAHQLRIRNCGGIIIIDFIDMEKEAHREKVMLAIKEELQKDRARTTVFSMSNLGLVEMTRKRIRPSLVKTLCEPCSYCDGRGYIKQKATVAHEIFRDLERDAHKGDQRAAAVVHCHADVGDWIYEEESEMLEYVENKIGRNVVLKLEPGYHVEQYEIFTM
ncbi:MAG: Rne/Rng family ribonuclease [Bdellovibrionaceae bacterium]|nr:Rne/Rng family ribonuclease [Pseudobdellovibrionaceae bacterium]